MYRYCLRIAFIFLAPIRRYVCLSRFSTRLAGLAGSCLQLARSGSAALQVTAFVAIIMWFNPAALHAMNQVSNGDFSFGNTQFGSDYAFTAFTECGNVDENQYSVGTNPGFWNCSGLAVDVGDHTTGTGNMLIANGNDTGRRVWFTDSPIAVVPNATYFFEAWILNWSTTSVGPEAAQLTFRVNGTDLVTASASGVGIWTPVSATWYSGESTTASLELYDDTPTIIGNDFAVDDIFFDTRTSIHNFIVNGDFSLGNTQFGSDYAFTAFTECGNVDENQYSVGTNPGFWNCTGVAVDVGDHTTGTGNMLIANGNDTGRRVWFTDSPITVVPNVTYLFEAWILNWSTTSVGPEAAQLTFRVNGTDLVTASASGVGVWTPVSATWDSGESTTASLELYDDTPTIIGNDFAVDDISFAPPLAGVDDRLPMPGLTLSAWPNPFNPLTTIAYELPVASAVQLTIYDAGGRLVQRLADQKAQATGRHEAAWDGRSYSGAAMPSGVYFCRFDVPGNSLTQKILIAR